MRLRTLLEGLELLSHTADLDGEITGVSYDSRATQPGDLFVAMTGFATDGHAYIGKALEAGAAAVLCERPVEGVPCVRVENSRRALAVDLFPRTQHVETVCLLSKLRAEHHIEVELNLDELDLTAAESKATYDEIKAYVLEQFGLKVSSLYISQVKRKCGLEVGENYNLAKSENAKVPTCPPEKEKAIMAALEHFRMV